MYPTICQTLHKMIQKDIPCPLVAYSLSGPGKNSCKQINEDANNPSFFFTVRFKFNLEFNQYCLLVWWRASVYSISTFMGISAYSLQIFLTNNCNIYKGFLMINVNSLQMHRMCIRSIRNISHNNVNK